MSGWADAAGYTISDLTMLRKELIIGFVVAGFADAAVPVSFWRSLFLTGHGFWSVLENVILGPFLAIISFVCSIGNVPLAAALWSGGIAFGGTVAFVFADLITLPLLLIYRRYYGTRLTIKLLAVFWATMSAAGLATEYLFRWAGIAPAARTAQRAMPGQDVWGWNYTTILDTVALAAFAACTGCTATGNGSAAAPGTPRTRCAACRSRSPTPRPAPASAARPTTSAPTIASSGSPPPPPGTPDLSRPAALSTARPPSRPAPAQRRLIQCAG